jgi:hypothetical protein
MYERSFLRDLTGLKRLAGISIVFRFIFDYFGVSFFDCAIYLLVFIYPVVESNSPLSVLLYLIRQFQAWQLPFPEDIMQSRSANAQFLRYATLFFIIVLHPLCEFIHIILFLIAFLWTEIRNSDTLVIIPRESKKNNSFLLVLACVNQYITMRFFMRQTGRANAL